MNNRLKEIFKFILTGGVCFLIEYAALILLKEWLHMPVVAATPVAFLISVVFNYLLCVKWVFSNAREGSRKAQLGFVITSGVGFFLNWALMWALTALFGEDAVLLTIFSFRIKTYHINKIIATSLVMVWNYLTKRHVLRKDR